MAVSLRVRGSPCAAENMQANTCMSSAWLGAGFRGDRRGAPDEAFLLSGMQKRDSDEAIPLSGMTICCSGMTLCCSGMTIRLSGMTIWLSRMPASDSGKTFLLSGTAIRDSGRAFPASGKAIRDSRTPSRLPEGLSGFRTAYSGGKKKAARRRLPALAWDEKE
ncbi:MAG: hypothetical protein ABWX93_10065 [Pseudoxanthomonas sp.]